MAADDDIVEAVWSEYEHFETWYKYNIDVEAAHILLAGENSFAFSGVTDLCEEPGVEYTMANNFIKNITYLAQMNYLNGINLLREQRHPIIIHLKTCGGDWSEGMAIYHAIRAAAKTCPITILNYTHARSMSSIIFQAATKRVMMPDSYFMIHHGTLGIPEIEEDTFYSNVDFFRDVYNGRKRMMDIYVNALKNTGLSVAKKKEDIMEDLLNRIQTKRDLLFTEWGAVEEGFADLVWDDYDPKRLIDYTPEDFTRNDNFKPRYK